MFMHIKYPFVIFQTYLHLSSTLIFSPIPNLRVCIKHSFFIFPTCSYVLDTI